MGFMILAIARPEDTSGASSLSSKRLTNADARIEADQVRLKVFLPWTADAGRPQTALNVRFRVWRFRCLGFRV